MKEKMKIIQKISYATLSLIAALILSACGGGGGGGGAPSPSQDASGGGGNTATIQTLKGVNGFKVAYQGPQDSTRIWTGSVTSPVTYSNAASLTNFTVADSATPAHATNQAPSGLTAGGIVTIGGILNAGNQFGGTTYNYARFGWLTGNDVVDANNSTTWYTPFALATSVPTSPADASYTGTNQALVYLEADRTSTLAGISGYAICSINATYTASSKSLQLTVSNCSTGVTFNISGGVTLANGTGSTTLTAVQFQERVNPATITASSVDSGNFLLAGPNGNELVGAATVKGSIALADGSGGQNPAIFFVIFGGKKQ